MKKHFMKFIPLCIVIALPSIMHATQTERDANREVYVTQQQKKGRVVTGTITDANDGTPIIGANIKLKQTNTGVISDIDGNFSINVNSSRDVLVM